MCAEMGKSIQEKFAMTNEKEDVLMTVWMCNLDITVHNPKLVANFNALNLVAHR